VNKTEFEAKRKKETENKIFPKNRTHFLPIQPKHNEPTVIIELGQVVIISKELIPSI
jgi:hypothetical protein